MARDIPAVRVLPMSDKLQGFRGRSIEQVQRDYFLGRLVTNKGRFRYPSSGLNAEPGTVVLFQYSARIVASAAFLRDEKFDRTAGGFAEAMYFDVRTIRTFDPLGVEEMRAVWPGFRGFGHVKQRLNPTLYPVFRRRLKRVGRAE